MKKPRFEIADYIDKRKEELVFIQGKIPRSLFETLKAELDHLGLSWNKYLIAVSQRFVEEMDHGRCRPQKPKAKRSPASPGRK